MNKLDWLTSTELQVTGLFTRITNSTMYNVYFPSSLPPSLFSLLLLDPLLQIGDYESSLTALENAHAKSQTENADLSQQLGDAEHKVGALSKSMSTLESQLEDLRAELQSESSVSGSCSQCI